MQYAIELFFDKETENRLFHLAERVAEEKISTKYLEWKTRPHITLACFSDVDEALCAEKVGIFAQSHKVMPVHFGSIGMFTDTRAIFASPIMNMDMYLLHSELHECLKDFDTKGWEWYCPNRWVPHCGLALTGQDDSDAFFKASDLLLREFEKMSGEFVEIGLVKISFPVEEIYSAQLSR